MKFGAKLRPVRARFAGGLSSQQSLYLAFVILTSSAPGAVLVKGTVGMLPSTVEAKARSAQADSSAWTGACVRPVERFQSGAEGLLSP